MDKSPGTASHGQAATVLAASGASLRALVDRAPVGLVWIGEAGTLAFVNGHFARLVCREPAELVGCALHTLVHPDDRRTVATVSRRLTAVDTPHRAELRLLAGDGRTVWVAVTAAAVRDADGVSRSSAWVMLEMPEAPAPPLSPERDQALRSSEERLRLVNEAAGIGTYDCDFRQQTVRYSAELCALLGEPEGFESTPDLAFAFVHPADYPDVDTAFHRALEPEGSGRWSGEFRIVRRDGEIRWLSAASRVEFEDTAAGRTPVRQMGACFDITERKRQEQELRESEERLQLAFAGAREGVWDYDLLSGMVVYSAEWKRMLGYAEDEIEPDASAWERLLHPDDRERAQRAMAGVIGGDESYEVEFRLRHKDGHYVDILSRAVSVRRAPDTAPIRIVGTHADLTERKRQERALRESEERLQFAFAGAHEGVWDWDLGTGAVVYSAEWKRMLGYADGEIEPHVSAWRRLLHPGDVETAEQVVEGVVHANRPYEVEFRLRHRDGHYVHVLSRGLPIRRDATGPVVRIVGTHFDLSERKRAEAALRESEERLRLAAESTGFGTYDIDARARRVVWSDTLKAILGLPPNTLPSLDTFSTCVHPDDRAHFVILLARALDAAGPGRHEAEYRVLRQGGEVRWLRDVGRTIVEGEGADRRAVRVVGTVLDVTVQKRAEELLRRAHDELESRVRDRTADLAMANRSLRDEIVERVRAERARSDLIRRLVFAQEDERRRIAREMHDQFGEQLTALGLGIRRLKEACGPQPALRHQVEELEVVAQQIDRDVDHLVWELRPTALDDLGLGAALGNYVHDWSRRVGVSVDYHTAGLAGGRLASEIETTLYRIAQEALTNIAKHARARTVEVILERRTDHVSLVVEDDGVGFDEGDSVLRGQGLGLSGIHERAAMIGARVQIESAAGAGTTIFVRIPTTVEPSRG